LSLPRALRALESSEGAEEKSYMNVIGSLKDPQQSGGPDVTHRDGWGAFEDKDKLAYP